MSSPTESITLYSERAERFREIKASIEEQLGYEPTNSEALGLVMADWSGGDDLPGFGGGR